VQNGSEITAPLRKAELDVLFNYLIRHQPFLTGPTDCVDLFPKLIGFSVTQKIGQIRFDFMCNGAQWILTHPVQYSDFSLTLCRTYDDSKSWTWLSDDVTVGYVTTPKYATHTVVYGTSPLPSQCITVLAQTRGDFSHTLYYAHGIWASVPIITADRAIHFHSCVCITSFMKFAGCLLPFKTLYSRYPIWTPKHENKRN